MALQTTQWDSTKYLGTDEGIAAYLDAVLEEGDPALVTHVLAIIARAKGMTQLADDAVLSRENLYQALSPEGKPQFATVLRVVRALGLQLHAAPRVAASPRATGRLGRCPDAQCATQPYEFDRCHVGEAPRQTIARIQPGSRAIYFRPPSRDPRVHEQATRHRRA
jgi:probable addiction module antidote protein